MPLPTHNDVHVNRPLTNIAVAYSQDYRFSVSDKVFPIVPVQHQSDVYWRFDKNYWRKIEAKLRAPGSPAAEAGYAVDTASYFCKEFALKKSITQEERDNADAPLDMDAQATRFVTEQCLLKRDADWASAYFTTGVWGTDTTPSDLWDTPSSDPIKNVADQRTAMLKATGKMPNTLVLGVEVLEALEQHPDLIERIKYTQAGFVDTGLIARAFKVDRVVIGGLAQNTANEGATASNSFLFGKHALLCYTTSGPSIQEPSAGYVFTWMGKKGTGKGGMRIRKFTDDEREADFVQGSICYDNKVVATDLGVFFSSVIS